MKLKKVGTGINKWDIMIFMLIILIFGGALLAYYPSLMTYDSLDQLAQFKQNIFSDAHPILHTLIIGSIYSIFNSTVTVAIFQIVFFAIIWTYVCHILRNKNDKIANKVFQIIFTIFICICPINYLYSITIWKDILYTYSCLGVLLFIYIGIQKRFDYNYFEMVIMSLLLVLLMKIRHNGVPIGYIIFSIVLILGVIKNKKYVRSIVFLIIFIISLILGTIPKYILNCNGSLTVDDTWRTTQVYSMGAILNENIQLEKEEIEVLDNILDIDEWRTLYSPYSGMGIIYSKDYNKDYLDENYNQFTQIYYKYAKKYPVTIIKHFININSVFWSIREYAPLSQYVTNNEWMIGSENWDDSYNTCPISTNLSDMYNKIVTKTNQNRCIYILTNRPAVQMYISIILVFFIVRKKKNLEYLLLILPMLLNIGTYLPFIISHDLRYSYPTFITCYFIILIWYSSIETNKIRQKNKIIISKSKAKVLTIIPAYNEEMNIKKVLDELKSDLVETDILVINDSSKDNTREIVEQNNVNCITTVFNLNYAYAVQTGIKYAKKKNYDYCLMFDGDGQHIAKEAKKLLNKIQEENCDIVIGSRYLEKGNYKAPKLRMIGTNFFSWLIKISCKTKITDPLSGFQVINKRVIDKYSKIGEYPEFPDANLIIEMLMDGYTIEEVSVKMRNREFGESMHGGILKPIKYMILMFYNIVILILNRLFGRKK